MSVCEGRVHGGVISYTVLSLIANFYVGHSDKIKM